MYLGARAWYRFIRTPRINYDWEVVFTAYPHLPHLLNSWIRAIGFSGSDFVGLYRPR